MKGAQTKDPERAVTVSFRTSKHIKKLIEAVAVKRGMLPSDWLRETLEMAVWAELGFDPPKEVDRA